MISKGNYPQLLGWWIIVYIWIIYIYTHIYIVRIYIYIYNYIYIYIYIAHLHIIYTYTHRVSTVSYLDICIYYHRRFRSAWLPLRRHPGCSFDTRQQSPHWIPLGSPSSARICGLQDDSSVIQRGWEIPKLNGALNGNLIGKYVEKCEEIGPTKHGGFWENPRSKWWILQQTMFDYQRVILLKSEVINWGEPLKLIQCGIDSDAHVVSIFPTRNGKHQGATNCSLLIVYCMLS